MSRRIWAVVVGVAVAVGAVIAVSVIAIGQDGDDSRTPDGSETRMRLDAVNDEVSCGQVAAVRIWLDDLTFRESDRETGVPAGMVGFQATLQYDPRILRVLGANDIELNADLGDQDVDDDGLVRSFVPAVVVDEDHLGRVVMGAVGFVPGSEGQDDNREEGVDPVSKGEPLLLMTVRFTPVGVGTTMIRNEGWEGALARVEPQVFDTDGVSYDPLEIEDTEITVSDGDCVEPPPSPTLEAKSTPTIVTTSTPVAWRTVEPTAATSEGRSDCPEGWAAYADSQARFSICYPGDFVVNATDAVVDLYGDRPGGLENDVSINVSWALGPGYIDGMPSSDTCDRYSGGVEGATSSTYAETVIKNDKASTCFTTGPQQSSLHGSVPVALDGSGSLGYVHFMVNFLADSLDDAPPDAIQIIGTLQVGDR